MSPAHQSSRPVFPFTENLLAPAVYANNINIIELHHERQRCSSPDVVCCRDKDIKISGNSTTGEMVLLLTGNDLTAVFPNLYTTGKREKKTVVVKRI